MVDATDGDARRTATVTVLFCDLVGSTARQTRLGDDAADAFRQQFFAALGAAVTTTRGEIVKNTGDGLMVVFSESAVDAVTCASTMHDHVEALDTDEPAHLRVGVSAGEAAVSDGDWFGTPVVEAARLCAVADAGQTLVSELVRGLVGSRGGHQFRSVGALDLKGLGSPLPAAAVIRTPIAAPITPPRIPRRRHRGWVLAVAAVSVIALATSVAVLITRSDDTTVAVDAATNYTPRFATTRCDDSLRREVPGVTCGELSVPEDRAKPRGRWINIPVVKAPARSSGADASPTIAISHGGPAENAATSPARDHGDLYLTPTRLAEFNREMECPEFETPGRALLAHAHDDRAAIRRAQAALRACFKRLKAKGVALERYTRADAGGDVIDLVRALRLPPVDLVATADTALSALVMLREEPKAIRSLTLENAWAPGSSFDSDPTALVGAAFDRYLTLCRASTNCARAYANLGARVLENNRKFDAKPKIVATSLFGNDPVRVLLDGARSDKAIAVALDNSQAYPLLAAGIANPQTGITAELSANFDFYAYPHLAVASMLSALCSYDRHTISVGRSISTRARPELSGVDDGAIFWACEAWPVPQAPDTLFMSAASDVPTLLVSGALAAHASPDWVAQLQSQLRKARVVTFRTLGMNILREGIPACLNDLRHAFLANPAGPLDTDGCAAKSPQIAFVAPTQ